MKITLVSSGALGDTLLLAPLLRSLKQRWPSAQRTLVTRQSFGELLLELNLIEHFADGENPMHSAWFSSGRISNAITPKWAACDLLISAVSNGADNWSWHATTLSSAHEVFYFSPRPPENFSGHITEFHRAQLVKLNLPEPDLPTLAFKADGPVMIHPGSGGQAKCFPLNDFVGIARSLVKRGVNVAFILGEAELERWDAKAIGSLEEEFALIRHPSLPRLADLLANARSYLGNDSGVSHLAGALGLPTVAIFITGNPRQFKPIGPRVMVIEPQKSVNFQQIAELLEYWGYPAVRVP
ncbi:MAG TPA: glycosyltransferase family 9 protein [Phycisphaerae bacterium]|nr:glycosyltransferase family 9 protein [Phycisphaerae bacterium]